MLHPTPQILEKMANATELAIFEPEVKQACLQFIQAIENEQLGFDEMAKHLFMLSAEVASSTASHIAIALFDPQELDEAMDLAKEQAYEEMEAELQKILADFTE